MKKKTALLLAYLFFWTMLPAWPAHAVPVIKNLIVKESPWVDVGAHMDGQSGRPTLAAWESNQMGTEATSSVMTAVIAAYNAGGGRVVFKPGATYIVTGLYPRDNVVLDLNGATLKLKAGTTHGILDWEDTTYALNPTARHYWNSYVPDGAGYTGGFYNMTSDNVSAGQNYVTLATVAEAGNFAAGDLAMVVSGSDVPSFRVVESIEVASSNVGTGVVTFKWPLQKFHYKTGTYHGIAKRDAGYVSGRGFKMMNGTLDAGTTATSYYLLSYEGMDMDFIDLKFKGQSMYFYNIRGTNCRLIRPRMNTKNTTIAYGGLYSQYPFSIDVGATNNTIIQGIFDLESTPGALHLGEGHSGTKFLYNVFNFTPSTALTGSNQYIGTTGMTFIGNTFYNYPGVIVGGGAFPDNTPYTQTWMGNEFYGQFSGALLMLSKPTGTPNPTYGHVTFTGNVAIGTFDPALVSGASPYVIRELSNATVEGNHIHIVNSSTGKINETDPSFIDVDTVTLRGNNGLPDLERIRLNIDDYSDNTAVGMRTLVNGFPVISYDNTATREVYFNAYTKHKGGKVAIFGRQTWVNLGAGSGNVFPYVETTVSRLGTALSATPEGRSFITAASAQNVPFLTSKQILAWAYPDGLAAESIRIKAQRVAVDASDTLENAAGLLGMEIFIIPMFGY